MEALGSPSISRAPMGGVHAFRKLVYAGNVYNDIHYRLLPEIHFTASGFFLKTFDRLCFFFGLSFCESTHYEMQKKNMKITKIYMIYKPVEQTHCCVDVFFRLSREKSVQPMCYQKICIKMYLMHKTSHA